LASFDVAGLSKAKINVIKTMIVIVICFVICFFPNDFYSFYKTMNVSLFLLNK